MLYQKVLPDLFPADSRRADEILIQGTDADRPFAGICASEKVANDGQTSIAVYTNGIFQLKVLAGGTQAEIGDFVSLTDTPNQVSLHDDGDFELGWAVGRALETIAVGATGMVRVLI